MSGTVNLNAPSYMPTLFGGGGAVGDSLLATLYGRTPAAGSPDNPVAALIQAQGSEAQQVAAMAAEPRVRRDLTQFEQALESATSPADLLNNPSALKVLLIAHGLGDQANATALAKQVLLSDPADPRSLVNRLPDSRWKPVVRRLAFAAEGLSVLHGASMLPSIANGYAEALWRQDLDRATPGLSNALDFLKRGGSITGAAEILGDPALRDVVTVALDIPGDIAFQSQAAQESAISQRVDMRRFRDQSFVNQLVQRYLMAVSRHSGRVNGADGDLPSLAAVPAGLAV